MTGPRIGRLALREEGEFWNAYFAMPDTMHDAILLGSIRTQIIRERPRRKAQFMALMREAMTDIIQQVSGERPEWPDAEGEPAPDHERSGNA
jgi:hypothetical protein